MSDLIKKSDLLKIYIESKRIICVSSCMDDLHITNYKILDFQISTNPIKTVKMCYLSRYNFPEKTIYKIRGKKMDILLIFNMYEYEKINPIDIPSDDIEIDTSYSIIFDTEILYKIKIEGLAKNIRFECKDKDIKYNFIINKHGEDEIKKQIEDDKMNGNYVDNVFDEESNGLFDNDVDGY